MHRLFRLLLRGAATRRVPYLVASVACVAAALVGALYALGAISPSAGGRVNAARATSYTVYWLGTSFEGLKFTKKIRRLEKPARGETFGADFVTYLYGTCKPDSDGGCPIPLEVQSWAACKRNLSVYSLTPDGRPLPHERLKIRGVPAALFEDGTRLEIYTGETTVVIFGSAEAQLKRAADAMRPVSGHGKPGSPLPAPAPGALTGKLRC